MELLEDETDLAAQRPKFSSAGGADVLAENLHRARGGQVQAVEQTQQGGFSGARQAQERDNFTRVHLERHVVERPQIGTELLRDAAERDGGPEDLVDGCAEARMIGVGHVGLQEGRGSWGQLAQDGDWVISQTLRTPS